MIVLVVSSEKARVVGGVVVIVLLEAGLLREGRGMKVGRAVGSVTVAVLVERIGVRVLVQSRVDVMVIRS